jgi:hypothetical protein
VDGGEIEGGEVPSGLPGPDGPVGVIGGSPLHAVAMMQIAAIAHTHAVGRIMADSMATPIPREIRQFHRDSQS